MASLPSNTFLCNYNAKDYIPSAHTIPQTQGQQFNQDLVLNANPSAYTENSIILNGQYYEYAFANAASNIFTRTGNQPLTIVAKLKKGIDTTGAHSLFSCRTRSYMNYVLFNPANNSGNDMVYIQVNPTEPFSTCPKIIITTEPNIFALRVTTGGTGFGVSYTDNQTFPTNPVTWGSNNPEKIGFFKDTYGSGNFEAWRGEFYWMYISAEELTDAEIQKVIKYNEGIGLSLDTEELDFGYEASSSTVTVDSENPWTASTEDTWITLSQYSGSTGGTITVSVLGNNYDKNQRVGTVEFTDNEDTVTLTVTQSGNKTVILKNLYRNGNKVKQMFRNGKKLYQMFERFFFNVDTDSIEFEYEGSTSTITINASDPWTMTLPEWVTASTISGTGSATVTLTTTQNPTEDAQTGSIVITCEGRTITIPVEQKGSVGLGTPMTFEILTSGYINWKWNNSSAAAKTIEYRINKGEWTSITSTSSGVHIDVVAGDKVEFRGNNASYSDGVQNHNNVFSGTTCQFNLYGNIMSLVNSTNFENLDTLTGSYNFARMFYTVTGIRSIENFYLPATGLTVGCYRSLFDTCTGITDASMLVLPATTLKQQCYNNLLTHCSELTKAPTLSASTLTTECYGGAFNDCPKLTYMKCLATSGINTNSSTIAWMRSVGSGGTFVKKRGVNWPSGENGIPTGWTVIEVDE